MRAVGTTNFGRAVAAVTSSPFGVGPGRFHYATEPSDVETVYLGTFDRRIVDQVGRLRRDPPAVGGRGPGAGLPPPPGRPADPPRPHHPVLVLPATDASSPVAPVRELRHVQGVDPGQAPHPALLAAAWPRPDGGGHRGVGGGGDGPAPPGGGRPAGRRATRRRPGRSACAWPPSPAWRRTGRPAHAGHLPLGLRPGFWRGSAGSCPAPALRRPSARPADEPAAIGATGWREYAVKGAHLGLRQFGQAPEQRPARRLARQAQALAPTAGGRTPPRVTILTPRSWAAHVQWEAMIAQALRLRGAQVAVHDLRGRAGDLRPGQPVGSAAHAVSHLHPLRRRLDRGPRLRRHRHAPRAGSATDPAWPELDELLLRPSCATSTYRGVPLGELVDIPVKWFLMGADVDGDPLGRR